MKIDCGFSPHETSEVELHLYSTNFKCNWHMLPPPDENGRITFDRDSRAVIKFHDTYELDKFIEMLQRFRDESRRQLGWWNLE